ncbi:hypothetical protein CCACVL1_01198, partial [Corchorus capsularis]
AIALAPFFSIAQRIPASKDLFQCVRFRRDGVSDSTPY